MGFGWDRDGMPMGSGVSDLDSGLTRTGKPLTFAWGGDRLVPSLPGPPVPQIEVPPKAQLIITLNQDGTVSVAGPINDQVLAYGLLKIAENAVTMFAANQQKSGLIRPEQVPIKFSQEIRGKP